jgi:hypothetical protein
VPCLRIFAVQGKAVQPTAVAEHADDAQLVEQTLALIGERKVCKRVCHGHARTNKQTHKQTKYSLRTILCQGSFGLYLALGQRQPEACACRADRDLPVASPLRTLIGLSMLRGVSCMFVCCMLHGVCCMVHGV